MKPKTNKTNKPQMPKPQPKRRRRRRPEPVSAETIISACSTFRSITGERPTVRDLADFLSTAQDRVNVASLRLRIKKMIAQHALPNGVVAKGKPGRRTSKGLDAVARRRGEGTAGSDDIFTPMDKLRALAKEVVDILQSVAEFENINKVDITTDGELTLYRVVASRDTENLFAEKA